MWKFALAVVMLLGLALGPSAETDLYGAPNVGVTFNHPAANVINSTPCISAQVQANTPYLGSLTIVPTDYLLVSFTLSSSRAHEPACGCRHRGTRSLGCPSGRSRR